MRLGILTPVVTALPRAHGPWEMDAGPAGLLAVAQAADTLGYHHLTCSEHIAIPVRAAQVRGGRYWDPVATFGFLAAATERISLTAYVVVLPYHHPLAIVKRYATVDELSGGRLVLGVGVGTLRREFDLLGAPFEGRGERSDDAIRALRASFGRPEPEYAGSHYQFSGMVVDPCGPRQDVPIWVGGSTARSLRRAVELGDGWIPFGIQPDELGRMIARARDTEAWSAREAPLEMVLAPDLPLDPLDAPQRALELASSLVEVGATIVNVRFEARSASHCIEQLRAMAELSGLGTAAP